MTRAFLKVVGDTPTSQSAENIRKRAKECELLVNDHWKRLAQGRTGPGGRRLEGRDFAAMEMIEMIK